MSEVEKSPTTPKEIIAEIQKGLQHAEAGERLKSIEKLSTLNYSSEGVLRELERLAAKDRSKAVRAAAIAALDFPVNRQIFKRLSKLPQMTRDILVNEIRQWSKEGLLREEVAATLEKRYSFDVKPEPAPEPVLATLRETESRPEAVSLSTPVPEKISAPEASKPKRSLAQVLFSESSIKIALYLGAFFIVAAALIFAATIEALRFPILLFVTIGFLVGALTLKKRLPQPSFTLFIIFSTLLAVDAGVLADMLNLGGSATSIYWAIVFFFITTVWGFSTWFYKSRFFSVMAFGALLLSAINFANIFDTHIALTTLMVTLATWGALVVSKLLRKWRDKHFATPLFFVVQASLLIILTTSFLLSIDANWRDIWWLAVGITWLLVAAAFAFSNIFWKADIFPYFSVAALIPFPWLTLNVFGEASSALQVFFAWLWGGLFVAASVALSDFIKSEKWKGYRLPLLLGSAIIFGGALTLASVRSFDVDGITPLFWVFLGIAIVYGLFHIYKPKVIFWSATLLSALAAYFLFFELPLMENTDIFLGYKFFGASLLLLLPDSLMPRRKVKGSPWRMPLQALGALMVLFFTFTVWGWNESNLQAVILFALMALFFLFYATRLRVYLAYSSTMFFALSAFFIGEIYEANLWMPILMALAVLYYGVGISLKKKAEWSKVFCFGSLILGSFLILSGLVDNLDGLGWYGFVLASLFLLDRILFQAALAEIGIYISLGIAIYTLLGESKLENAFSYSLLIIALLWLVLDALFERIFKNERNIQLPLQLAAAFLILFNTFVLLADLNTKYLPATISFSVYALFFVAYAIYRKEPLLGYLSTAYLPLAILAFLGHLDQERWLFPLIVIAVLYYGISFFVRKSEQANWQKMLEYSSLILGTLVAFSAPLEDSGLVASIPVAITATLYAIHAFRKKNIWLGFPANAFYLMAYFMILLNFEVDQPQFFTVVAAALGMLMHYLLVRSGSKTAAFITGMLSQLVLLSTTYFQLVSEEQFIYFIVLFFQAIAVLIYGIIIRSKSLVITPIIFLVLSVITVTFGLLDGWPTIFLIGCTGVFLIAFGIGALLLREKVADLRERLDDWNA
ncbi:MAG: hypothetical protein GY755_03735 [Chloroflexi bacterium]|nr:hypothetical protein [Chloroflexota bacterium]